MRYRACRRRVKQHLRQELSLSASCLVTFMEKEMWQATPQKPLPQLASLVESQAPWEGGMPQKSCPEAPFCGVVRAEVGREVWGTWAAHEGRVGPTPKLAVIPSLSVTKHMHTFHQRMVTQLQQHMRTCSELSVLLSHAASSDSSCHREERLHRQG